MDSTGLRGYLYEFLFYRTVETQKDRIRAERGDAAINSVAPTITVSQAREFHRRIQERLNEQNLDLHNPTLNISMALTAMDSVLREGLEGYESPFDGDLTSNSPFYASVFQEFAAMAGRNDAPSGEYGHLVPISPYDDRFAHRENVRAQGSHLSYVEVSTIDAYLGGSLTNLPTTVNESVVVSRINERSERLEAVGPVRTVADVAGITQLAPYMSLNEVGPARDWVLAGLRDPATGMIDPARAMSPEAMERTLAILDDLSRQGVDFTITPDRNIGQLKATLTDTNLSVRLTDVREAEDYVGSTYRDGVTTRFSGNIKIPGSYKTAPHKPTPSEVVDLLHVAQGKAVQRWDDQGVVGAAGHQTQGKNDVYIGKGRNMAMRVGPARNAQGRVVPNSSAFIVRNASSRSRGPEMFYDEPDVNRAKADQYLVDAVESAQENFDQRLNIEYLIEQSRIARAGGDVENHLVAFDSDESIAFIQEQYWNVLTGQTSVLEFVAPDTKLNENDIRLLGEELSHDEQYSNYSRLTPEEQVRAHAHDLNRAVVGTFDPHYVYDYETDGLVVRRFDPVGVAKFATTETGPVQTMEDLVSVMRLSSIQPEELRGDSSYNTTIKNRLVRFDPERAQDFEQAVQGSEFLTAMYERTRDALVRQGVAVDTLMLDEQGVVRYKGLRTTTMNSSTQVPVTGYLGQIFEPGDHGEVVTRFGSGGNYMFVPGYDATVLPNEPGENKSLEERTVLRGYEQMMGDAIEAQLASDLMEARTIVGDPSKLNSVYRKLTDTRHPVDFLEQSAEEGMSSSWVEAILATEAKRVRFSNKLREESTVNGEFSAIAFDRDMDDDLNRDGFTLTGGRNMSIITPESDGYFDPVATSTATNQGIVRYLVESAQVDSDGHIIRGDVNDRTPVMKHPDWQFAEFDAVDRQQMTFSNIMNASSVTAPLKTAHMTFGGWTYDDSIVLSREAADDMLVRGVDGEVRSLIVGDKILDFHGNKGVVSLIVDRNMSLEEAETQGLSDAVAYFKANPDLDVVMAPFSAVSRFNGGSTREMAQNAQDLHHPDGSVTNGGVGECRFVVTHMAVDVKTKMYDEEQYAQGRGRRASSQLGGALGSQGADKVAAEFFGRNDAAVAQVRELLNVAGYDLDHEGALYYGHIDHPGENRILFERDQFEGKNAFAKVVRERGGDLEIPWDLSFVNGTKVEQIEGRSTYKLPILSAGLRSGQTLEDGSVTTHDYTNQYLKIFNAILEHEKASLANDQKKIAEARADAQRAFDYIGRDVERRALNGKHNIFKEKLMAHRLPDSATAVWTGDPRLDLDQVAMSSKAAQTLGIDTNDPDARVMIWRDPVLRDSGVRYMRVAINDELTGVAINPLMDKSFDGDFDGDAVAVVKLNTKSADAQARLLLSPEANPLDLGVADPETGMYPLSINEGLDVQVALSRDAELKERYSNIHQKFNDNEIDYQEGSVSVEEKVTRNREVFKDLSDLCTKDMLAKQYGTAVIQFDTMENHIDSLDRACIQTGAKGSPKKLEEYTRYVGADPKTHADLGRTLVTREDTMETMYATAVKAFGTGIAGAYLQRGMMALRNSSPEANKAVLELTAPVTQSVLQVKHDPVEARQKLALLRGPARELWRGRELTTQTDRDGHITWSVVRDERGKPVQASKDKWVEQFKEFYTAKDGLNVKINADYVSVVAEGLAKGENNTILNLEDDRENALGMAALDQLALSGSSSKLAEFARDHRKLYEGSKTADFAPFIVRDNMRQTAAKGLFRKDTQAQMGPVVAPVVFPNPEPVKNVEPNRARTTTMERPRTLAEVQASPRPYADDSVKNNTYEMER